MARRDVSRPFLFDINNERAQRLTALRRAHRDLAHSMRKQARTNSRCNAGQLTLATFNVK
jgi:uncharacterized protein with von Willebrand factor type A (vWA) domain